MKDKAKERFSWSIYVVRYLGISISTHIQNGKLIKIKRRNLCENSWRRIFMKDKAREKGNWSIPQLCGEIHLFPRIYRSQNEMKIDAEIYVKACGARNMQDEFFLDKANVKPNMNISHIFKHL